MKLARHLHSCILENTNTFALTPTGNTGKVEDMRELGVWEPYEVKAQTLKTAVEAATLLLRIDDIVSGLKKRGGGGGKGGGAPQVDSGENVDSEHMLQE